MSACESCHAGCCRSFAVPITGADILRLERTLQLPFWDFACRWADPQGQIARKYAPHFHFPDEPKTPFVIALRHVDSVTFPGTTKCRFLKETPPSGEHPHGLGQCGVYESRPSACRAFPTKFNATGDLAIIYDVPERGRTGDSPAYQLCPRPWTPADIDPITCLQDLAVAKFEMAFFHQLATAWNRNPHPWELFPDFLRLAYAGRVQTEQAKPAATPEIDADDDASPQTIPFPQRDREQPAPARREAA